MKINGLKVVDAKRKVKIHITPVDVAKGKTKNPSSCAAARACVREQLCSDARVHIGRTYLKSGEGHWVRFKTPQSLRSEIVAFDRGARFAPGEYTLSPLAPAERSKRGKATGTNTSKTTRGPKKARAKYHTVQGVRRFGANR